MSDEELVKEIQNGINVADNMEQLYCRSQSMINKIVKKIKNNNKLYLF